ncbi:holo-ACP synthase [Streptomyces sp. NPDC051041]|uniref:holo-ACP synthase n=1 Tax=Streptomyces sp. NPDC051041 TaxID=3365640 RepID=UPI0037A34608
MQGCLERNPRPAERLFTPGELLGPSGAPRTSASSAARFAAEEAEATCLSAPGGLRRHDAEVRTGTGGRPCLDVRGTAAAAEFGITSWQVLLTHDADVAPAVAVAS